MTEFKDRNRNGIAILRKRIAIQDGCGCGDVFERKLLAVCRDVLEANPKGLRVGGTYREWQHICNMILAGLFEGK